MRQTGAALVLHDARVTDGNLNEQAASFFAMHGTRAGYAQNLWRNHFVGCCMAFRRDLLKLALPMPRDIPMHDQWLGLLAEKRGGVALLDKPLIDYRRHGQNATSLESHGRLAQMLKNRLSMFRAVNARLGNPDISKGEDLS